MRHESLVLNFNSIDTSLYTLVDTVGVSSGNDCLMKEECAWVRYRR